MAPLDDTMLKLMFGGIGGLLAAIVDPVYMRHPERSRLRIEAFAELVSAKRETDRAGAGAPALVGMIYAVRSMSP